MDSELSEQVREKFESMIVDQMAKTHVPGLSLAIVKDNQVIYAHGFGSRNLKENLPATPDTLYGIGSCTKSFTALAIMQLVERGKIDVHDPVNKYLPQFKLQGKNEEPITIHHLLTHSSGAPNLGIAEILIERMAGLGESFVPLSSLDDFLLHINGAKEEVAAEPGKKFFYFNEGYTLLGVIVEKVSRVKYADYIKENILKPLKMNRSTFNKDEFEKDQDIMTPYLVEAKDGEIKATPAMHPFEKFIYAAGGLLSSTNELTHYLIANMNGGVYENQRIIDAVLLEKMHTPYIKTGFQWLFGEEAKYGYGWMITENFFGHKVIEHGGSTGLSSAELAFMPDQKIGVALASNIGGNDLISCMPAAIMALLLGKDPEKDIPAFKLQKKMSMLVGEYTSYKGLHKVTIKLKNGLLYIETKEKFYQLSSPLIPESEDLKELKFYIPQTGYKLPVEFEVVQPGKIDLYIERNRFHKTGTGE
jgi:CubicO group peptidase (beta-lactamase class C family)